MMITTILLALVAAAGSSASIVEHRSNGATAAADPSVIIYPPTPDGEPVKLLGSQLLGLDRYLGLPFASPPVDDLRFVAPQTAVWNSSVFNATTLAPACLQPEDPEYPVTSEDCLYLNVFTPPGTNATNAYLPVMVWIYGGGFFSGGASLYDPTVIMKQAIDSDRPVIYVAINYRLGVLGFPYGQEAAANGAANLGLRDVKKGLEWVQEHIWAFGGNPDDVTIFGQSAGAILISYLYLQPEINLFKRAIMHSGAPSTVPIGPTDSTWQIPYDRLVDFAGCNTAAKGNSSMGNSTLAGDFDNSFDCLKSLPGDQLLAAQIRAQSPILSTGFVFAPSIDGDLIPDSPHRLLEQGKFARIPFISGNVKDEGTAFVDPAIPNNETIAGRSLSAIEPGGLPQEALDQLFGGLYPTVPALGSPFGTGNETFGLAPTAKQAAAVIGDKMFQANRRWFLRQAAAYGLNQTWSYNFEAASPIVPALGTFHTLDVFYLFGLPTLAQPSTVNWTSSPVLAQRAAVAAAYGFITEDVILAETLVDKWLNFACYTDPNGIAAASGNATTAINWPPYVSDHSLFNFTRGNLSLVPDDYRMEQMEFMLAQQPEDFNY